MDFHFSSNNFSFFSLGSNLFLRVYFFNYLFSGDLWAILGLWLLLFFKTCLFWVLIGILWITDVASAPLVRFLCLTKNKKSWTCYNKDDLGWLPKTRQKGAKRALQIAKNPENSHDDGKCAGHWTFWSLFSCTCCQKKSVFPLGTLFYTFVLGPRFVLKR